MRDQIKERALFEESPIIQAIIRLAFPTVIGQIIMVVSNMADTFFIGLMGSDATVTAVTICMPAFMFLSAISSLFGIGGASVISRALGARKMERARDTASFAFWGCLALTLLYTLGVWIFMDLFIDARQRLAIWLFWVKSVSAAPSSRQMNWPIYFRCALTAEQKRFCSRSRQQRILFPFHPSLLAASI